MLQDYLHTTHIYPAHTLTHHTHLPCTRTHTHTPHILHTHTHLPVEEEEAILSDGVGQRGQKAATRFSTLKKTKRRALRKSSQPVKVERGEEEEEKKGVGGGGEGGGGWREEEAGISSSVP